MRNALLVVLAALAMVGARTAQAQYVREQSKFVGPIVALNFQGSQTAYFGVNFEYMLKRDVGVGGMFRYFTYTAATFSDGGTYVFSGGVVAATANYHFKVPQNELDPFVGAAIGVNFASGGYKNTTNTFGYKSPNYSDIVFAILAGARYFLSDRFAAVGRLAFGANYNAFEVGADFSL